MGSTDPRLLTLGAPQLRVGEQLIQLQPRALALLAYLAVEGPKTRTHLSELLWNHSENGLNSLSSALSRIRSACTGIVETGGQLVSVTLSTDVDELTRAAAGATPAQVLDIYRGRFLDGIALRNLGVEFEEWILSRRATTCAIVETSVIRAAQHEHRHGRIDASAALAEQAFRIAQAAGLISTDHLAAYNEIFASAGHHLAAEVRREAHDLGIELSAVAPADAPLRSQTHRPVFGFEEEQRAVSEGVQAGRLTQIIGLGGSGKTLLATNYFESAPAQTAFPHRHWIDLTTVEDPDLVEAAIAAGCGLTLHTDQVLADVVAADAPMLIVIDNFEQVIDAAPKLTAFVAQAPLVAIVVTSRVPLSTTEVMIQLGGLPIANDAESPAHQLWAAAATRAGATEGQSTGQVVSEICHLVGGLPLAIELAASWSRVLPVDQIAQHLRRSSEILESAPAHEYRSVQLVLDESVRGLTDESRMALDLLAGFPAGLAMDDASAELGLSLRVIANLADRSMLIADRQHGRLSLHPLVAGHRRPALAADPSSAEPVAAMRHAWCDSLFAKLTAGIDKGQNAAFVADVERELPNLVAIWNSTLSHGPWDSASTGVAVLREFYTVSGRLVEGKAAMEEALTLIRSGQAPVDLVLQLIEANAWMAYVTGLVPRTQTLLGEAEQLLATAEAGNDTRALILRLRGTMEQVHGDTRSALATFDEAVALTSDTTPSGLVARLHLDVGTCHERLGQHDAARAAFRTTLAMGRELGDPYTLARAYIFLASLEQAENPKRCLVLLDEGQAVCDEHGLQHLAIYFPLIAGQAFLNLNDATSAQVAFDRGMELASSVGQLMSVAASHVGLGECAVQLGDPDAATEHLVEGIRASVQTDCMPYLLWAAVVASDLVLRRNPTSTEARETMRFVTRHPGLTLAMKPRADHVMNSHSVAAGNDTQATSAEIEVAVHDLGERLLELLRFG